MMHRKILLIGSALALTACTSLPTKVMAPKEDPVVQGPKVRRNATPLEPAFTCLARALRDKHQSAISIAVGDVKDYTGKYSQNEGNAITQGGALMAYSALGKLGDVVQLHERFDTRIGELELAYTDRRQLGDGKAHAIEAGKPPVSWVPYFGGTILRSQYYIIGGITEVNYDISSGGYDVSVNNVGPRHRTYTMNIGVDLRLVDTQTLVVVKTVSLQKQIKGEEVGFGIYRFFGNDLLDLNVGSKQQEPLQLGVRTTIEQGVLELVAAAAQLNADDCIADALAPRQPDAKTPAPVKADKPASDQPAADKTMATPVPAAAAASAPAPAEVPAPQEDASGVVGNPSAQVGAVTAPSVVAKPIDVSSGGEPTPQNGAPVAADAGYDIEFGVASAVIASPIASVIDRLAKEAGQGKSVEIKLLARDTELYPPMRRDELTDQRIRAVSDNLAWHGIRSSRLRVTWRPDPADASVARYGNGMQLLARIHIGN